uniref:Uncharacterized protein n=1 Tax=Ditylum brightwellii TaxID=49249 RepID=A0A7S2EJC5_9STRA|mmetsp:Transcript_32529/g.48488  ORF Transcript_32529/g.48488 Transcript_32529/m.48488 type:complete len:121 (+) Transcript_32529:2-364(+)
MSIKERDNPTNTEGKFELSSGSLGVDWDGKELDSELSMVDLMNGGLQGKGGNETSIDAMLSSLPVDEDQKRRDEQNAGYCYGNKYGELTVSSNFSLSDLQGTLEQITSQSLTGEEVKAKT